MTSAAATIGHNSNVSSPDQKALAGYVREIELFEDEKRQASEHISEIYKDAKEHGFDTKALREVIRWRRADAEKLRTHKALVETYAHALGMLFDTPLGEAAIDAASKRKKPPVAKLPDADTSNPPFSATDDDEPRTVEPDPADLPARYPTPPEGEPVPKFLERQR